MNQAGISEPLRLDLADERLWDGERVIPLPPTALSMLRYFVTHPNQLLTKEGILEAVWPDTFVTEALIKDYVQDLRRALGDDPKAPRFIETVRGRGYRYLGGIACNQRTTAGRAGPPRVVVLPWLNFHGAKQLELFGRGFSAELIKLLAKNRDLAVIAKSSAATIASQSEQIKRSRQELRADYVVDGEIFPNDNGVRFALSAVNTETEAIIWSDTFTVQESELRGFEEDLVPRVAMAIGARSGPLIRDATASAKRRLPADLTAFEQYLLALDYYAPRTNAGFGKAHEFVNAALRGDPGHAQSWLLLAYILEELRDGAPSDAATSLDAKRTEAIGKAATLDPFDGRVLIEHADYLHDSGDAEGSAQGYAKAYEMNRGGADVLTIVAKYLAGVNCDADEARSALTNARDLNPVGDANLALNELRTFYILGDLDAALKAGDDCPDTSLRSLFVALSHMEKGQSDVARDIVLKERQRHPEFEPVRFFESHHYIRAPKMRMRFQEGLGRLSRYLRSTNSPS